MEIEALLRGGLKGATQMADISELDESGEEDQRDTHQRTTEKKKDDDGLNLPSIIMGLSLGFGAAFISFIYALAE
jgi:hypothetical protein